jgi:hypothetical protein
LNAVTPLAYSPARAATRRAAKILGINRATLARLVDGNKS